MVETRHPCQDDEHHRLPHRLVRIAVDQFDLLQNINCIGQEALIVADREGLTIMTARMRP